MRSASSTTPSRLTSAPSSQHSASSLPIHRSAQSLQACLEPFVA
jgi:hypothetical protein